MLHQALFLAFYLRPLAGRAVLPLRGRAALDWLDNLPPDAVYTDALFSDYLSFVIGALSFLAWLIREKKTLPRPLLVTLLMAALLLWVNVTSLFALAPRRRLSNGTARSR